MGRIVCRPGGVGLARLTCLVRRSTAGQASGLLTVAKFSCRWLGWAKTVRAWQQSFPLSAVPLQGSAAEASRQTVDAAVREGVGPFDHVSRLQGARANRVGAGTTCGFEPDARDWHQPVPHARALLGPDGRNLSGRFAGTLSPVSAGANLRINSPARCVMNFGFLVRCDRRGTTFCEVGTSGPAASQLLSVTIDNDFQAVFLGRLYYLDDLRRRLAAEHRPEAAATPAEYVRAVYEQAGAEGLSWLEGDYSFVLWDARERRLIAARDPMGGFPLFWVRIGEEVALSNAMRPLLDLVPQRRLNLDYLAEFLVLPFGAAQELHGERCAYEGVHRVLAGTRLEVSPGGSPKSVRWWDWLAQMEEPESLEPAEIAARYGELLDAAVAQRRGGPDGGAPFRRHGFDGGRPLAARQAHAAGEEPVHGLALVYERQNVLSPRGLTSSRSTAVRACNCNGFRAKSASISMPTTTTSDPDEPVLSLYQSAMCHALLKRAAEIGARTLMTGFGADELVGLPPFPLYDHLRTGRWFTAWREASALAARAVTVLGGTWAGTAFDTFCRPVCEADSVAGWRRTGRLGKAASPHDRSVGAAGICPAARTVAALGRTPAPPIKPLPSAGAVDGARGARIRHRRRLPLGSRCAGRRARRAAVS